MNWIKEYFYNLCFNKYQIRLYGVGYDNGIIDGEGKINYIEYKQLNKKEKLELKCIDSCLIKINHNGISLMPFRIHGIIEIKPLIDKLI